MLREIPGVCNNLSDSYSYIQRTINMICDVIVVLINDAHDSYNNNKGICRVTISFRENPTFCVPH